MRCYLIRAEDSLQASQSPVGDYDDNKEAKSVCMYVHVIQGDSKEDMGMHMTATDRLDRADEVQSIIYGLQFY